MIRILFSTITHTNSALKALHVIFVSDKIFLFALLNGTWRTGGVLVLGGKRDELRGKVDGTSRGGKLDGTSGGKK